MKRDATTHLSECQSPRTDTNAGQAMEQHDFHSLLVGKQNGAASLEDNLFVSYKTKHTPTTAPGIDTDELKT